MIERWHIGSGLNVVAIMVLARAVVGDTPTLWLIVLGGLIHGLSTAMMREKK